MESNSNTPNPLVKAAALAWYKHAGAATTPPSPRPTSHLLVPGAATASPKKTPPSSPAITLLDKYEIEWITTQLQRLITSSSSSSVPYSSEESGNRHQMGKKKKKTHRRILFGFGSRYGRHATMLCGSGRDAVVETTSKSRAKPSDHDLGFKT